MRSHTHDIKPALAGPVPDGLYRLVFVGGPFDGHETQSAFVPDEYFQLRLGATDNNRAIGATVVTRLAQYKLVKSKLVMCSQEPIVLYRFEFCGMVVGNTSKPRWWTRCLPVSWQ